MFLSRLELKIFVTAHKMIIRRDFWYFLQAINSCLVTLYTQSVFEFNFLTKLLFIFFSILVSNFHVLFVIEKYPTLCKHCDASTITKY